MTAVRCLRLTVLVVASLAVVPAAASAQGGIGGRLGRAIQNKVKPDAKAAETANASIAITNESLDAYIKSAKALVAETKRIQELQELSRQVPTMLRLDSLEKCRGPMPTQEANPTMDRVAARAQANSGGTPMTPESMEKATGMSMEEMQKLAAAAEKGDTAAKRKMMEAGMKMGRANSGRGVAVSEADRQKIEAVSNRNQAALEAYQKRSATCENSVPQDAFFARRINAAKAEIQRVGQPGTERNREHLDSLRVAANGGVATAAQLDGLYERIVAYISSDTEPSQGYSKEELAVLRARKAELKALREGQS